MSVPFRVDDGDLYAPLVIKRSFRRPFANKGVLADFEMVVRFRQDKRAIQRFTAMERAEVAGYGSCYLVDISDTDDTGDGMHEYDVTYASIPSTRTEGQSINFTEQWYRSLFNATQDQKDDAYAVHFYQVNFDIAEQTFVTTGEIVYEYFKNTQPPPLHRSRAFLLFENLVKVIGDSGRPGYVIADDSEVSIYKGQIWQRVTPYVKLTPTSPVPAS